MQNKYRSVLLLLAIVALVVAMILIFRPASAEEPTPEPCVPSEAWTETIEHPAVTHDEQVFDYWQNYSWRGSWESNTQAPPFPDSRWQANTKSDPHDVGVEGAYFMSNGNSGGGDWFYLESVEKTVTIVDEEAWIETIEHEAVTCPEVPTETPTVETTPEVTIPVTPTETPAVEIPVVTPPAPESDDMVICGVTVQDVIDDKPIPRDILCPLPFEGGYKESDPVVKTETINKPTKTVKIFTHESGLVSKSVTNYGDLSEINEEGY